MKLIVTRLSRTRPHVVGGGPSAVVLSELQLVGLVLVGLGALRQVVTLRPLLGVLADHLAERISVRNAF